MIKTSYLELVSEFQFYLLVSDFLAVSKSTKLVKKITHLKTQFRSKNLTDFMNLNSLNIVKKYTPATQPKT